MQKDALSIIFGIDEQEFRQTGKQVPVKWTENVGINAHMLVLGKSGSGKTVTLRRIVGQISAQQSSKTRIYVFDVAGDLSFPKESAVLFSESTHYGINPLGISADPHFGGIRKRVQGFIEMMNDSGRDLGPRQTATIRNVLYELYDMHGYRLNDPTTWFIKPEGNTPAGMDMNRVYLDIPFEDKDQAKDCARREGLSLIFDANLKCWHCDRHEGALERWPKKVFGRRPPTLQDAARFTSNKMRALAAGGGSKTMRLLEEHNKKVAQWVNKAKKLGVDGVADIEELRTKVHESSVEIIESFSDYVLGIETGKELDALIRYDSVDTMRGLVDRLETLVASGIYKTVEPPFDPSMPVWRYNLAPLDVQEQKMFVWTRLTQIFEAAMERGPLKGSSEIRDVIVLDEAHHFFSDKETNILDRLSKEARKYGIALICASQSPTHFSEDFLGNVGTKILLGLDSLYHDQTVRKMRIDPKVLQMVVPKKIAAIQISSGEADSSQFRQTRVSA